MPMPKSFPCRAWPAALLAVLLAASPAAAQTRDRGPSAEARAYAEMMDVSLEEAQRRLALQLQLSELEPKLRQAAADSFAGLWIEHQPRFSVQARFKDPAAGERLLRPLVRGLAVELEVAAAAASLAELEALQEATLQQLRAAGIAVDADLDVRANRVEISTTAPSEVARLVAALPAAAPSRLAIVPVAELAQPFQASTLRGGRPLTGCSSAFTARTAAGAVGVLTAGHCADAQNDLDSGETLPYVAGQLSGNRDVQFHSRSCAFTVPNQFDSGTGIRQVTGTLTRDQQLLGSMVCRYGKTTPQRCGQIVSKNVCPSYVANCSSTFIRIASPNGQPIATFGDSGGPVFFGTLAYGILSGGFPGSPDAFYMPINYASTIADVLTSNGGTGSVTATMPCTGVFNGSTQITCYPAASGGVPPYTFANWIYTGDADMWSTYFNTVKANYLAPGCWGGAHNYFAVTVTDQCGTSAGASAFVPCPAGCFGDQPTHASLLPPVCSAAPSE